MVRVDEEIALVGDQPKLPWWKANKFYSHFVFPFTLVAVTIILVVIFVPDSGSSSGSDVKNVILMIPDGFGSSAYSFGAYRSVALKRSYELDNHVVGKCRTLSASSLITDSAAAGTALSCGIKTNNGVVGQDPSNQSCETILEKAKKKGLRTGLVATSRITHATPAAFSAHVPDRDLEDNIAYQQVQLGVDVLLGGGRREYEKVFGTNTDTTLKIAQDKGYNYVQNNAELGAANELPLLGLFSRSHIPFTMDRTEGIPSLPTMTTKALELLNSNNKDGFFLMVEGSRIDQAAHNDDSVAFSGEILEFDDAVKVVIEFAKKNPGTQVVIVADHETGGFSLGAGFSVPDPTWNTTFFDSVPRSAEFIADTIIDEPTSDPVEVFTTNTGVTLTPEEEAELIAASQKARDDIDGADDELEVWIGLRVSKEANVGWTTDEHTSSDVEIFAYGPQTDVFRGFHDNTNIPKALNAYLEL